MAVGQEVEICRSSSLSTSRPSHRAHHITGGEEVEGEKLGDVHRRMPACAKASHLGYGHAVRPVIRGSNIMPLLRPR